MRSWKRSSWSALLCTVLEDARRARAAHLKRASPSQPSPSLAPVLSELQCLIFYTGSSNLCPVPSLDPKTDVPLTCYVGKDQQQAAMPHLRLGKE